MSEGPPSQTELYNEIVLIISSAGLQGCNWNYIMNKLKILFNNEINEEEIRLNRNFIEIILLDNQYQLFMNTNINNKDPVTIEGYLPSQRNLLTYVHDLNNIWHHNDLNFKSFDNTFLKLSLTNDDLCFVASLSLRYSYLDFCPLITINAMQYCTLEFIGKNGIDGSDAAIICSQFKLTPKCLFTTIHKLEQFGLVHRSLHHAAHEKDSNKFWTSRFFVLDFEQAGKVISLCNLNFIESEQIPCLEMDVEKEKKIFDLEDEVLNGLAFIYSGLNSIRWEEEIRYAHFNYEQLKNLEFVERVQFKRYGYIFEGLKFTNPHNEVMVHSLNSIDSIYYNGVNICNYEMFDIIKIEKAKISAIYITEYDNNYNTIFSFIDSFGSLGACLKSIRIKFYKDKPKSIFKAIDALLAASKIIRIAKNDFSGRLDDYFVNPTHSENIKETYLLESADLTASYPKMEVEKAEICDLSSINTTIKSAVSNSRTSLVIQVLAVIGVVSNYHLRKYITFKEGSMLYFKSLDFIMCDLLNSGKVKSILIKSPLIRQIIGTVYYLKTFEESLGIEIIQQFALEQFMYGYPVKAPNWVNNVNALNIVDETTNIINWKQKAFATFYGQLSLGHRLQLLFQHLFSVSNLTIKNAIKSMELSLFLSVVGFFDGFNFDIVEPQNIGTHNIENLFETRGIHVMSGAIELFDLLSKLGLIKFRNNNIIDVSLSDINEELDCSTDFKIFNFVLLCNSEKVSLIFAILRNFILDKKLISGLPEKINTPEFWDEPTMHSDFKIEHFPIFENKVLTQSDFSTLCDFSYSNSLSTQSVAHFYAIHNNTSLSNNLNQLRSYDSLSSDVIIENYDDEFSTVFSKLKSKKRKLLKQELLMEDNSQEVESVATFPPKNKILRLNNFDTDVSENFDKTKLFALRKLLFMIFACPQSLDISRSAEIALSNFSDNEVFKVFNEFNSNKWIIKVSNNFRSLGSYRVSATLKNSIFSLFPNFKSFFNSADNNLPSMLVDNLPYAPISDLINGVYVARFFNKFANSTECPIIIPFSGEDFANILSDFSDEKSVSMPPIDLFFNLQNAEINAGSISILDSILFEEISYESVLNFIKSFGECGVIFDDILKLGFEASTLNVVLKNLIKNNLIIKVVGNYSIFYLHSDHISIWGMDANEVIINKPSKMAKNKLFSTKKLFAFEPWMNLNGDVNEDILNMFKTSLKLLVYQYPGSNSSYLHTHYNVLNPIQIDYICGLLAEIGHIYIEDSVLMLDMPEFLSRFLPTGFYSIHDSNETHLTQVKRYYPNFNTLNQ